MKYDKQVFQFNKVGEQVQIEALQFGRNKNNKTTTRRLENLE